MAESYIIKSETDIDMEAIIHEICQTTPPASEMQPYQEHGIALALSLMRAVRTSYAKMGRLDGRGVLITKRFETVPIPLENLDDVKPGETYECATAVFQTERHYRLSRMSYLVGRQSPKKQQEPESVKAYWQMRLGNLGVKQHDEPSGLIDEQMVEASYNIPSTVIPMLGKVPLLGGGKSESVHWFTVYATKAAEALRLSGMEIQLPPIHTTKKV